MSDSTASTPDEIRDEIEQTRAELSETVDALTAKLDVKAQAKDKVAEVKDKVVGATASAKAAAPAPVQNALDQAGAKASPLVAQAKPYGKQIAAGVAALLALVLVVRRRSK